MSRYSEKDLLAIHFHRAPDGGWYAIGTFRDKLGPQAIIWVSWPKKSAKVPTDIGENAIRDLALPLGFVDVKVCAVDDTWSGLKLVVRKALR